jgi:hypothetical protein
LPNKNDLDELLDLTNSAKISENSLVRVAYQYPFKVVFTDGGQEEEAIPYTFEDALVLSNITFFRELSESTGLTKKMSDALLKSTLSEAMTEMFDALDKGKKAEMALELLYLKEPNELTPPKYIAEGLEWLQEKLKNKDNDSLVKNNSEGGKQ